jgi:hypothetical protein
MADQLSCGRHVQQQEQRMTTRITLGPKDSAFVLREDGKLSLVLPSRDHDEEIPDDELALTAFAAGFHDDRVREVLWKILNEKRQWALYRKSTH